jgi:negative regulator of sigma E activity
MSGHERERLSAYLDGELPAAERAEVAAHLAACPECAELLAAFAAVDEEAGSLPAEAPDGYFDGFAARVTARLAAERPAAARARRLPAWTWAAAAALLLAVVTPLTLRRTPAVAPAASPATPEAPAATPLPTVPEKQGRTPAPEPPPAAPVRKAAPPAALPAPVAPTAPAEARAKAESREEAAADLAKAPTPAAPVPAEAARAQVADAPAARAEPALSAANRARAEADFGLEGGVASGVEGGVPGGVVGGVVGGTGGAPARTPEEWRRRRDEWSTLAASAPAGPRADEARVRAIEAGWEAWRLSGSDDDEAAFRRDARAYLEREDALQKPRVERLLARPRPSP